jgi:hypothetical protein
MAICKTFRGLYVAILVLASVPLGAADNFRAGQASDYQNKQSQAGVTLAVKPFHTELLEQEVFDKSKPSKYGMLAVLVVVTNDGDAPIKIEGLHARYVRDGSRVGVDSMSAEDLFFYNPKGHAPKKKRLPGLGNMTKKVKKGPLSHPELAEREFSVPVVLPGETASGFFYFNVGLTRDPLDGASLYAAGMTNMSTGNPLFYFEVPLD